MIQHTDKNQLIQTLIQSIRDNNERIERLANQSTNPVFLQDADTILADILDDIDTKCSDCANELLSIAERALQYNDQSYSILCGVFESLTGIAFEDYLHLADIHSRHTLKNLKMAESNACQPKKHVRRILNLDQQIETLRKPD